MCGILKRLFQKKNQKSKMKATVTLYVLRYLNREKICLEAHLNPTTAAGRRIGGDLNREQVVAKIERCARKGTLEMLRIEIVSASNRYEEYGLRFDDPLLRRVFEASKRAQKTVLSFQKARIYEHDPLEEFFPLVLEDHSVDKLFAILDLEKTRFDEVVIDGIPPMTPQTLKTVSEKSRQMFFRNTEEGSRELSGAVEAFWREPTTHWVQYPSLKMTISILTEWHLLGSPFKGKRFTVPDSVADGLLDEFSESSLEEVQSKCLRSELTVIPSGGSQEGTIKWLDFHRHITSDGLSYFLKKHPSNTDRFVCLLKVPKVREFPSFSGVLHLLFV
ncbi:hypothetical protein QR680_017088 [Steinernema hermaphroditum]|uniref:Uncharacterized protein n=1 Tax=Steinernema hermaphroditum TaxID=289476 RepID=A0AA39HEF9_9BILA|nr:hypothetical protein QR680_017088 [Steinernema hermaphroditum]